MLRGPKGRKQRHRLCPQPPLLGRVVDGHLQGTSTSLCLTSGLRYTQEGSSQGRVWERSITEVHPAEAIVPKSPSMYYIVTFQGTQLRRHAHGHRSQEPSQALYLWVLPELSRC